jgi:integrase
MICDAAAHGCATWPAVNLEQIQFLLGHASVQTTERYLGCKQRLSQAVNDRIGMGLQGRN